MRHFVAVVGLVNIVIAGAVIAGFEPTTFGVAGAYLTVGILLLAVNNSIDI